MRASRKQRDLRHSFGEAGLSMVCTFTKEQIMSNPNSEPKFFRYELNEEQTREGHWWVH